MLKLHKSLPVILIIYFLAIGFMIIINMALIYELFSENYFTNPEKYTIQPDPVGQRKVFLKIVFDKPLTNSTIENWQEIIETAVGDASQIFSNEFKISLILPQNIEIIEMKKPQFSLWGPLNSYLFESVYYLLHDETEYDFFMLKRYSSSSSYDIIVAFTNKDYEIIAGRASNIPSRYVIISGAVALGFPSRQLIINHFTNVLIHELSHCFGAKHVHDKGILYVMNPEWESYIDPHLFFFDKKNQKIILKNKWIDFKKLK